MKKKRWKLLLSLLIIGISICFLLVQITCIPITKLTRLAFQSGKSYSLHPAYETRSQLINKTKDITYPSMYEHHTYDIYQPKAQGSYPLLLWVHGGAFVGGDKQDNETYMEMIASFGYTVVSMNYALAPEASYPTPLLQMNELIQELKTKRNVYQIDEHQIFLGGDSAGAHIALQFTAIQTNPAYETSIGIPAVINASSIKGYVSLCGLLDILTYSETDSWFFNFLYDQSAWAYFDTKQWKTCEDIKQADVLPWINESFPSMFLSDGDTNSFLWQMKHLKRLGEQHQIPITSITYDTHLPHEYQFQLERKEALHTFDALIAFLDQHTDIKNPRPCGKSIANTQI